MPDELQPKVRLEIAHVLFLDIVGYSKLLISEQGEQLQKLKEIVWATEQFRAAQAEGKLLRLPTGDGGALVFRTSPEAPVLCAQEISKVLKAHPELRVRMGIHGGPVNEVTDLNAQANMAGAGINIAQRVMDCGDAGHILLSKHVADDIDDYPEWRPYLHDLGDCEVKHGVRLHLFNLYGDEFGNPAVPEMLKRVAEEKSAPDRAPLPPKRAGPPWPALLAALLLVTAVAAGVFFFRQRPTPTTTTVPAATPAATPTPAAISEKSIAVLPFENLSSDKENAFFADGVQDEILTDLAKIADLKVISRTSVMQYKTGTQRNLREIGRQLGVAHLLEGSVQRAPNKVRVNAQLIDARTDAHKWAQVYDRPLDDAFAIQSEIAKAIADQLQARLSPNEKAAIEKPPTTDLAAFDLYVRATEALDAAPNSQNSKEKFLEAVSLFEQAIAHDPAFLNAYCKLAQAHDQLYLISGEHTAERLALAEDAVTQALRLQPEAPEAHLARAGHLYSKLDYDGARAEMEIARRTLPNDPRVFQWSGYIDRRQGRWEESARSLERALELDPQNFVLLNQISSSYDFLREYTKEAAVLERALGLKPNDLDTRISRAQLEVHWKADPRPMRAIIESVIHANPRSAAGLAPSRIFLAFAERDPTAGEQALVDLAQNSFGPDAMRFPRAYGEGLFARLKGDAMAAQASFTKARIEQQKIVDAQPDYGPALCVLGLIDAGLGRKEDAIREGRRAAELMPPTKDSINGAHIMNYLAVIYAWVGEKELAIEQLTRCLQTPGRGSYGQLRLFPQWDPLRGDPRFEKIVAAQAPK